MRKPNSTEKYSNLFESTMGAAGGLWDALRSEKKVRQVFLVTLVVTAVCVLADVGYFQIFMIISAGWSLLSAKCSIPPLKKPSITPAESNIIR